MLELTERTLAPGFRQRFTCGGRLGWGKVLQDGRKHPVQVGQDIGVPKPQHAKAQSLKKFRAPVVVFLRLRVLAAVHFDKELVFKAAKVSKELAERILAAESGAGFGISFSSSLA